MQDELHQVGIAALGHGREEVPADRLAAAGQPRGLDRLPGPRRHGGLVEHDPPQVRVCLKEPQRQSATPAADVDDGPERREVVRGRHRPRDRRGIAGHDLVEERPLVGVPAEVREEVDPVYVVERRLPRPHAMQEVPTGPPERLAGDEEHHRPQRPRCVAPERLGQRRQGEPPVGRLREHALARQQPQHAVERRRVRAGRGRQVVRAPRPAGQQVGDAQVGRGVERLADAVPEEEVAKVLARRGGLRAHRRCPPCKRCATRPGRGAKRTSA